MLMCAGEMYSQVAAILEREPVCRDTEYTVVQIGVVGVLESGPSDKFPVVGRIELRCPEYGHAIAEDEIRASDLVGKVSLESPVTKFHLVAKGEHEHILTVPVLHQIGAVQEADRTIISLILC